MSKVIYVRKKTPIMKYSTWMELTKGSFKKPRSKELKKLDKAVDNYHRKKGSETALKELDTAFNTWCKKAGEHRLKQSLRNRYGAVSQMGRQIAEAKSHAPFVFIDKELQEAIDFMESEQIRLNRMVFFGARVVLKSKAFEDTAKEVQENAEELKSNLEELTGSDLSLPVDTPLDTLKETISQDVGELFGGELGTVMQFIGEESYKTMAEDIITGMIPIYAQLKAGAEMVKAWTDVARKQYKIHDIDKKSDIVNAKDPAAALAAIVRLLKRERTVLVKDATAATANFASSVTTAALDGGTVSGAVVGTATAVANLVQSIVTFVRDIKEMNYANALLAKGVTHLGIFEACPLLGCYLFCPENAGFQYSAFSGLIRQSFTSWGTEGYTRQLEYEITKKLGTIKEEASRIMEESRMTVVGIGKGEVVKETRVMKDSAVQRLALKPVTTRETDPLDRIRMLHQIKRKVYLRSIERFDKSTLKHVGTRDRSALLSDIRNFDKSKLKHVKTRHRDPVADLKKFNHEVLQFRHLDHQPMSHTMFNREMFAGKAFRKGVIPCTWARHMLTIDEWKSASSIRGMRTKLTKTLDDGLVGYENAAALAQKAYNARKKDIKTDNHNILFLEKGRACILERLSALGLLKVAVDHWLDVKKEQVTSKRRPAVLQLFQCVLQEEEALSALMDVLEFYHDRAGELGLVK
ncbi:MAG: hypothetical protein MI863_22190 [Desulfobacterales bacterium]|nr:hypothetical protein [Desulfobacterales bacterium]